MALSIGSLLIPGQESREEAVMNKLLPKPAELNSLMYTKEAD
jgi:hypothetical protein